MKLKRIANFDRPTTTELIEANLRDYFDWGCVQAGGFVDAPVLDPGRSDPYADSTLTAVEAPGYAPFSAWRTRRPNWCHERRMADGVAPVVPDGVYVDGVFHETASTTGVFAHRLDFVRGMVVFENPLLPSSIVQVAHSWKRVGFHRSTTPWFQEVVLDGWAYEEEQGGSGDSADVLELNRIAVPAVVVEVASSSVDRGYEVGGSALWKRPIALLHVLAATPDDRDRVADLIVDQFGASIPMYDLAARRQADEFELDASGGLRPGSRTYPEAVADFPSWAFWISKSSSVRQPPRASIQMATCRLTLEAIHASN